MAKSRKRAKRPAPLSGIPSRVVALAPRDWPPERQAAWCRHYLDGAAGRPRRDEAGGRGRQPFWVQTAYRMGQSDAERAAADVAQADHARARAADSRSARARMGHEAALASREGLLADISRLESRLDPHADPRVVGAALGALGISLEALAGPSRGGR